MKLTEEAKHTLEGELYHLLNHELKTDEEAVYIILNDIVALVEHPASSQRTNLTAALGRTGAKSDFDRIVGKASKVSDGKQ